MRRIVKACRPYCAMIPTAIAAIGLAAIFLTAEARCEHRLISQDEAARLGLTRAWFTQVRLNAAHTHVERAVLEGDRLTVLTSAGVVQELNALTGQTYWIAPIGNENYPSLGPAGNDKFVALLNGSTLYVLDRKDGKPAMIRSVAGAPGAAPALSQKYVFIPLVSGRLVGYSLSNQKISPWYYQSFGRAMVTPFVTPESIVWTTDTGHLYVAGSDKLGMRYRLETGAEIVAPPSYLHPFVFVASLEGDLFAMHEMSGSQRWKYSCGFPVTRAAAGVGDRVFVTSAEPALHCINATSGTGLWEAPHVNQFAAISKDRVYAVNDLGEFVVLNAATGVTLAKIRTDRPIHALVNDQTDRVYLVSESGMIECLHEVNLKTPIYHNPKPAPPKEEAKPAAAPAPPTPTSVEKPAKAPAKAKTSEPAEKPEAEGEKMPDKKGDAGTEENPFG
jgi:outer membrane protein assembly factor BamB